MSSEPSGRYARRRTDALGQRDGLKAAAPRCPASTRSRGPRRHQRIAPSRLPTPSAACRISVHVAAFSTEPTPCWPPSRSLIPATDGDQARHATGPASRVARRTERASRHAVFAARTVCVQSPAFPHLRPVTRRREAQPRESDDGEHDRACLAHGQRLLALRTAAEQGINHDPVDSRDVS